MQSLSAVLYVADVSVSWRGIVTTSAGSGRRTKADLCPTWNPVGTDEFAPTPDHPTEAWVPKGVPMNFTSHTPIAGVSRRKFFVWMLRRAAGYEFQNGWFYGTEHETNELMGEAALNATSSPPQARASRQARASLRLVQEPPSHHPSW